MDQSPPERLYCWYDGSNYCIAASAEEASRLYLTDVGESHDDGEDGENEWVRCIDWDVLLIDLDDGKGPRSQRVADWIAECGRGLLASEDY